MGEQIQMVDGRRTVQSTPKEAELTRKVDNLKQHVHEACIYIFHKLYNYLKHECVLQYICNFRECKQTKLLTYFQLLAANASWDKYCKQLKEESDRKIESLRKERKGRVRGHYSIQCITGYAFTHT